MGKGGRHFRGNASDFAYLPGHLDALWGHWLQGYIHGRPVRSWGEVRRNNVMSHVLEEKSPVPSVPSLSWRAAAEKGKICLRQQRTSVWVPLEMIIGFKFPIHSPQFAGKHSRRWLSNTTPHPAGGQKFFKSLLGQNADQNMKWQELLHANRGRASWYNPLENILAFFFLFSFSVKEQSLSILWVCNSATVYIPWMGNENRQIIQLYWSSQKEYRPQQGGYKRIYEVLFHACILLEE